MAKNCIYCSAWKFAIFVYVKKTYLKMYIFYTCLLKNLSSQLGKKNCAFNCTLYVKITALMSSFICYG